MIVGRPKPHRLVPNQRNVRVFFPRPDEVRASNRVASTTMAVWHRSQKVHHA